MGLFGRGKTAMVEPQTALPGREREVSVPDRHAVLGTPLKGPFPAGVQTAVFGMGCFWGAERIFWEADGVYTTAVGYAGGLTPNPTYEEVCSGRTGQAEVVLVAFDTALTSYDEMLRLFWEGHDPTQGMRQGNDVGTQYRSLIIVDGDAQRKAAEASLSAYQQGLSASGYGQITTEVVDADPTHPFYYAEDYHQQYLAKNPGGYCGLGGTGVSCPVGLTVQPSAQQDS
ncbi:MAG TPA: peptide-methionine (S)-S-oxide reductase MsrA [Solirubrobacteraceae bacterium]|jgi:peptide-methionine (S)-S-oxide reductase